MFKFENELYFTTKALFHRLQETNLITLNLREVKIPNSYKRNEREMMYSTEQFKDKFTNMMTHIAKLNHLDDYNHQLQMQLENRMQEYQDIKTGESLNAIRRRILEKRRLLEEKRKRIAEIKHNL